MVLYCFAFVVLLVYIHILICHQQLIPFDHMKASLLSLADSCPIKTDTCLEIARFDRVRIWKRCTDRKAKSDSSRWMFNNDVAVVEKVH